MTFIRRFLAVVTHSGPGYDVRLLPARGDAVETWLRTQRDRHIDGYGPTPGWYALNEALDRYRLHADTCTPLIEPCNNPRCTKPKPHDSHGVTNCIGLARTAGIPVTEVRP